MVCRVGHKNVPENVELVIINDLGRMCFRLISKIMWGMMRMIQ
jgi:hypothetical protein